MAATAIAIMTAHAAPTAEAVSRWKSLGLFIGVSFQEPAFQRRQGLDKH
jgi:hypothetical protein